MTTVVTFARESCIGSWARNLRISLQLMQQDLAEIIGASPEDVDLFEHNLPIPLDIKRKLMRELWARRAHKY